MNSHVNDIVSLLHAGNAAKAVELCREYLKEHENDFNGLHLLGVALGQMGDTAGSIEFLIRAIALRDDISAAHSNLGRALIAVGRHDDAIASCIRALELDPQASEALFNLALAQSKSGRSVEAIESYERLAEKLPDSTRVIGPLVALKRRLCDWRNWESLSTSLYSFVDQRPGAISPFTLLCLIDDPETHLANARGFASANFKDHQLLAQPERQVNAQRIPIAYLSANFEDHPTTLLASELFERHDRMRFEVHGISCGINEESAIRRRAIEGFDRFYDLGSESDLEIANIIRDLGIAILVHLDGYTIDSRPGIVAHRPAPIQVNFLGYAGTMGAEFMDYILVDNFIMPPGQNQFYSEQVVRLPNCYQANPSTRDAAAVAPTRKQLNLPENGFVFCCFNNSYKISPTIFDVWMELLYKCEGSVLWLLVNEETTEHNLRREATNRGINPERLVFAERKTLPDHLARHKRADLFLDTFPYNAHTTASDALWMGLPLVTVAGNSFASRVAGSCLSTVGLSELIATNLAEYEALALELVHEPARLQQYRHRLVENRDHSLLFDCEHFTRNLERAYSVMVNRLRSGLDPAAFTITETGHASH